MADDYASVLALIQETVIEPSEATHLKGLMREALWEFRNKKFIFSEKKTTFPTVANQSEYTQGTGSVPADIMRIERLRVIGGSVFTDILPVGLDEFRDLQATNTATSSRPRYYTWFARKIELWPTPNGVLTIYIDYHKDLTRNSAGTLFDENAATTFTNEFFVEGRDLLISYVLTRWGLGRGRDPELAQQQGSVYQLALKRLSLEYTKAKWGDGQAGAHF